MTGTRDIAKSQTTDSMALELVRVLVGSELPRERRAARRQVARGLLHLARDFDAHSAVDIAAIDLAIIFLRRYDKRRSTQEAYARDLAHWLIWLDRHGVRPLDATLTTVERYAREPLDGGRDPAPATIARRLACLSAYYERALHENLIQRNPIAYAERPRVPDQSATLGLSQARARRLIQAARAEGATETVLVLLLLELGLRVSEVVGIDLEDLGRQGRHRVLKLKGKGQATKSTLVPLNPAVAEAVDAVVAGRAGGPLITTSTGRRLTRQHAGKLIRRLGQQIGEPQLHPHALRHSFVTIALDQGASLRHVQDAARHADPRTTRRYDRNRHNLDSHPTHQLAGALEG